MASVPSRPLTEEERAALFERLCKSHEEFEQESKEVWRHLESLHRIADKMEARARRPRWFRWSA
jgi:hypothetical protein